VGLEGHDSSVFSAGKNLDGRVEEGVGSTSSIATQSLSTQKMNTLQDQKVTVVMGARVASNEEGGERITVLIYRAVRKKMHATPALRSVTLSLKSWISRPGEPPVDARVARISNEHRLHWKSSL
jgi:hypothetical protein